MLVRAVEVLELHGEVLDLGTLQADLDFDFLAESQHGDVDLVGLADHDVVGEDGDEDVVHLQQRRGVLVEAVNLVAPAGVIDHLRQVEV